MRKILLLAGALICGILGAQAQLVGGNAYLQGQYIEVGINQCGSWGTTNNAPTGYHARSGVSGTSNGNSLQNLGFVADPDKNGWTVGTPNKYNGDYFMPASPYCGWGISFGSFDYGNDRDNSNSTGCGGFNSGPSTPFPGSMQSVTNSNGVMQALWQGTANNMQVQKIVTVRNDKLYFTVQVKLKNTGTSAIANIYYGDFVNPDNDDYYQDVFASGTLSTRDTIVFQNPTNGKSLVKATGSITKSYLALGSKDCRSKVGRVDYTYPSGPVDGWYMGTTSSNVLFTPNGTSTNNAICIAYSLGTLAAGDSTSFTYTYILKETDFDEALAATDPGFTANGMAYQSSDTALACSATPVNIRITNGEFYNWTWSPATGLNTTIGPSVTATVTQPITYIATGIGACGNKYDTVTIVPATRLYVDSSVAVSSNGSSWAKPMKSVSQALNLANASNCLNEIWVRKGTYYPMLDNSTVSSSRDSSFRILRNGVKLYGGFAGMETTLAQRNILTNVTTLSGNIGAANDSTDNAYHVMTVLAPAGGTLDTTTRVSGFTIKGGNANSNSDFIYNGLSVIRADGGGLLCAANSNGSAANALIDNCIFTGNYANVGGGMYCGGYTGGTSSPTVNNCLFTQNRSDDAAGIHVFSADAGAMAKPVVTNCRFIANTAIGAGAIGVNQRNGSVSSPTFLTCVFSGNTATSQGGAVNMYDGSFIATNCVFTGNTSPSGSVINISSGRTATFNNSTLYNPSGTTGTSIVNEGTLNLNNTIVWGTAATQISGAGTSNAANSNIRGLAAAGTNLSADPQFINAASPIGADAIGALPMTDFASRHAHLLLIPVLILWFPPASQQTLPVPPAFRTLP
jgi:predicted outer membrane repeat protein